ncbi:hypothetical protein PS6_010133 [Mucor atramentarius]
MSSFDYNNNSHRRYNPLTKSWVLCSPHRTQRPWQGQQEGADMEQRPQYDPKCYLCPGNERASGESNPKYDSTFRFPNDYAAVKADQPDLEANDDDLIKVEGVRGECHVICFSPRHDLTLAEMPVEDIKKVVDIWTDSYLEMKKKEFVNHVQIFENKGAAMGCSNPHPHGQMWCTERIPEEPSKELIALEDYKKKHNGKCLLCDYAQREMADPERKRTVFENDTFLVVVPFWAVWPFEVMVLPKTHIGSLPELDDKQKTDLADAVRRVTCRYDNLFKTSFPYSMGIHQKPLNGEYDYAHLHLHYYPPLLRSATVRKFLVGFEMLGEPQRDLTPEQAAARLRELPEYSFGSFVHGSNQPLDNAQEHKKNLDRLIDDGNHLLETSKSPKSSTRPSYDVSRSSTPTAGIMTPSLPCLDSNNAPADKQIWEPRDEKTLIERLELLKKIRAQPDVDSLQANANEQDLGEHDATTTTTARWKRQFTEKAKKFCKEAQVDNSSLVSSSSSSDISCEKKAVGQDEEAAGGITDATEPKKICCRRSFICFMLGFLFPPLWLWGAFYISSYAQRQTSASNRIDHIWRRRSRIAFGIFTITLMIILVIVFVLKPETVGWRQSKQQPLV